MQRMREGGFNLGGEQSGHMILSDISTTGDGLISALQVLAVMVEGGRPMSELARQFDPVPQKMLNVRIAPGGDPMMSDEVLSAIKGRGGTAETAPAACSCAPPAPNR